MPKFLRLMITIVVVGGLLLISQQVFAQTWIPVRAGIPFGISGIALINQQSDKLDFLIVHDNKRPNQGRLGIISLQGKNQPEYLPLNWPNEKLPKDLEVLTSIPDTKNSDFIAVKTHGKASNFQLDCNKKVFLFSKNLIYQQLPKIAILNLPVYKKLIIN